MKGALIIIEGNISAGKTTLVKKLGDLLEARTYIEPALDNPYLERFYKDPKKFALTMQVYLLQRRFLSYIEALKLCLQKDEIVLLDRSIFSDYVFAVKNYRDGNISKRGFEYYLSLREKMLEHLPVPHATLYLDVPAQICHDRILHMRCRECESGIPLEYLAGLEDAYKEMLQDMKAVGSEVLVENWTNFGSVEHIAGKLEEALKKAHKTHEKAYDMARILLDSTEKVQERMLLDYTLDGEMHFDSSAPSAQEVYDGSTQALRVL